MIRSIFAVLLISSSAYAQLMITAEHVPATTVLRVNRGQYKHAAVVAERLPDLVEVDLIHGEKDEYRFPPEAPGGKYRVVVNAFDAELGIGRKTLLVNLGDRPSPDVDPVDPTDPADPTEKLSPLAKDSRIAVRHLVADMAANYETIAKRASEGKYLTVLDAMNDAVLLDLESRNRFKAAMAVGMKARLGDSNLPADASAAFSEIASGFRGVK